jgi:hypothetical protein
MIEEIVEALSVIDISELPESPRGDTIRGLLWALESLNSRLIEPRDQRSVPFDIRLTKKEAAVGQAAINEAWQIISCVLVGLFFLKARGYVNRFGVELPTCWSPSDFYNAIEDARAALVRLEALNDKLYNLQRGRLPKEADTKDYSTAVPAGGSHRIYALQNPGSGMISVTWGVGGHPIPFTAARSAISSIRYHTCFHAAAAPAPAARTAEIARQPRQNL